MDSGIAGTDNRQFRSIFSQYGQYREKVFRLLQERMKQPASQVSLALVGTLILIAALGILALRPTILTISSLIGEIGEEQKLVQALEDKFRALVTIEGLLEGMNEELPRINWAVPSDQEFQIFAKEVEILAKDKGLTALEISQGGFRLIDQNVRENTRGEIRSLDATVSIGGSEASTKEFLADLIKMDRLVVMKSVDMSSVPKDRRQDEPYQVKGIVMVEILWSKE